MADEPQQGDGDHRACAGSGLEATWNDAWVLRLLVVRCEIATKIETLQPKIDHRNSGARSHCENRR